MPKQVSRKAAAYNIFQISVYAGENKNLLFNGRRFSIYRDLKNQACSNFNVSVVGSQTSVGPKY